MASSLNDHEDDLIVEFLNESKGTIISVSMDTTDSQNKTSNSTQLDNPSKFES